MQSQIDTDAQHLEACLLYVLRYPAAVLAQSLVSFIATAVIFYKNILIALLLQSSPHFHTPPKLVNNNHTLSVRHFNYNIPIPHMDHALGMITLSVHSPDSHKHSHSKAYK